MGLSCKSQKHSRSFKRATLTLGIFVSFSNANPRLELKPEWDPDLEKISAEELGLVEKGEEKKSLWKLAEFRGFLIEKYWEKRFESL